jgi:NADH-quinone oxidoreductase subunit M
MMFGKVREDGLYGGHSLSDINGREIASLAILGVFIVWIGVYPGTFLSRSAPVAKQLVQGLEGVRQGVMIKTADAQRAPAPLHR